MSISKSLGLLQEQSLAWVWELAWRGQAWEPELLSWRQVLELPFWALGLPSWELEQVLSLVLVLDYHHPQREKSLGGELVLASGLVLAQPLDCPRHQREKSLGVEPVQVLSWEPGRVLSLVLVWDCPHPQREKSLGAEETLASRLV